MSVTGDGKCAPFILNSHNSNISHVFKSACMHRLKSVTFSKVTDLISHVFKLFTIDTIIIRMSTETSS